MSFDVEPWEVPLMWPHETVAVLGGGQTLTREMVDHCRGRCRVIAINRAYMLAPWADWLWGGDADHFWHWHPDAVEFAGIKTVMRAARHKHDAYWEQLRRLMDAGVKVLCHSSRRYPAVRPVWRRCSSDPGVVHGNNSACGVLSVVHHTGAARVVLLGVDCGGEPWFDAPYERIKLNYDRIWPTYESFAEDLAAKGVDVVNCSPMSRKLLPFRHARVEDVV